jgi:peroxiredoxin
MVMPSQPAFITNGRAPTGRDQRFTKTNREGRFAFPSEPPPFTIVVLHDRGFAERTSAQLAIDTDLPLSPWGRVEGTFRRGGQPLAGQRLQLNGTRHGDTPKSIPYFSGEATSDTAGHFAFERVIPGEVTVSEVLQLNPHMYSNSRSVRVEAKADETVRVDLGGTGRPVVGRLRVPPELAERVDLSSSLNSMSLKRSKVVAALNFFNLGKSYPISLQHYGIKVEADGTFRIEDVDAGTYDVSFMVNERPSNPNERPRGFADSLLGTARREVIVPEMPDGRSDTPLEVGDIALEAVPAAKRVVLNIADPAPMFEFQTLDGQRVRLTDYRGKFVLLDFWATWCGPCLEQTPHLKSAYEAFGKDDRFTMIGLSLDQSKEAPRLYADKESLPWIQGFLGEWSSTKIPDDYGVRGIPSIWLIGPDGTILAKDLHGEQIKTAVAEALGRK